MVYIQCESWIFSDQICCKAIILQLKTECVWLEYSSSISLFSPQQSSSRPQQWTVSAPTKLTGDLVIAKCNDIFRLYPFIFAVFDNFFFFPFLIIYLFIYYFTVFDNVDLTFSLLEISPFFPSYLFTFISVPSFTASFHLKDWCSSVFYPMLFSSNFALKL